jgi:general secretion pathway protein D
MNFLFSGQFRRLRRIFLVCLLAALSGLLLPLAPRAESGGNSSGRVSLDFNDVELSVFVRFISELTGKNFVLDDVVKKAGGKISVYSPTKVTHDQAYSMFVAALEVSRLAVVPKGNVYQSQWEIFLRNEGHSSTNSNTPMQLTLPPS